MKSAGITELVQKGNPNQLTINQHVFPARSILRFMDRKRVEVMEKRENRKIPRKPDDALFIAKRLWDHHSEHGFMHDIEALYQQVADKIISGHRILTDKENRAITDFYSLWNLRQREKSSATIYDQFPEFKGKKIVVDKDRQERHEKRGVTYWNEKGEIPNRVLTGNSLWQQVLLERKRNAGSTWGIFEGKTDEADFLVPDRLSFHTVVPVSPKICLVANQKNRLVDFVFVARMNGLALDNSENFYFAKKLENCPILLGATLRDDLTRMGLLKYSVTHD